MISKKVKAILGLYVLITLSAFVNSCCKGEYRLTGFNYINATATEIRPDSTFNYVDITTVTGEFSIIAHLEMQLLSLNNISLMSSSYATSCDLPTVNPIQSSSIFISMNKPFVLHGDTIEANTDLLSLNNSGILIGEQYQNSAYFKGPIEFHFTEHFFNSSILENGNYTFYISAETEEKVKFESNFDIEFDL